MHIISIDVYDMGCNHMFCFQYNAVKRNFFGEEGFFEIFDNKKHSKVPLYGIT